MRNEKEMTRTGVGSEANPGTADLMGQRDRKPSRTGLGLDSDTAEQVPVTNSENPGPETNDPDRILTPDIEEEPVPFPGSDPGEDEEGIDPDEFDEDDDEDDDDEEMNRPTDPLREPR